MIDVKLLSFDELDHMLEALQNEKASRVPPLEEVLRVRIEFLRAYLTKDLVEVLAPKHTFAECSDHHQINGFEGHAVPPCARCGFLHLLDMWKPPNVTVDFDLVFVRRDR